MRHGAQHTRGGALEFFLPRQILLAAHDLLLERQLNCLLDSEYDSIACLALLIRVHIQKNIPTDEPRSQSKLPLLRCGLK